jgi:hypothetical protein
MQRTGTGFWQKHRVPVFHVPIMGWCASVPFWRLFGPASSALNHVSAVPIGVPIPLPI